MNERDLSPGESSVLLLDEAETLIWALLDDQLENADTARLSKLLQEHEAVRRRYLECVQLHVDLRDHFATAKNRTQETKGTAILPNLMPGGIVGSESPVAEQ